MKNKEVEQVLTVDGKMIKLDLNGLRAPENFVDFLIDEAQEMYGVALEDVFKIQLIKVLTDFTYAPSDLMTEAKAKALDELERNLSYEEFVVLFGEHYAIFKIVNAKE